MQQNFVHTLPKENCNLMWKELAKQGFTID